MHWNFTLNYAFTDIETNASREIDILAEKAFWLIARATSNEKPTNEEESQIWEEVIKRRVRLNIELLIECKKTESPLAFFCRPKQFSDFVPSHTDDIISARVSESEGESLCEAEREREKG
jgi:hypothetical protein